MCAGRLEASTASRAGIGSLRLSEQASRCGHLPVCRGERMRKALPAEQWSQIKNVFGNLFRTLVMFPDGKWPDHWVDVKRKCLCGEGQEGRIKIQRVLMNTIMCKRKGL